MNKQKTKYILLIVFVLSACAKNFEQTPPQYVGIDYAFDTTDPNGTEAELFLNSVYATMPLGYNRIGLGITGNTFAVLDGSGINSTGPLDATTDDGISSIPGTSVDNMTLAGYTPQSNPDDCWANSYNGIRKANIFLANYTKVPWATVNKIQYYGAEARFLRAFFYFELIKRYGGVILLGDKILSVTDNLDLPRSSYEQCVNYILAELDDIKDKLRPDPLVGADIGRISSGAAYALKAKILLYAASPINNPSNDLIKWKSAADAAQAVMSLGTFQLEPNIINVFTTLGSKENIFYRMNGTGSGTPTYTNTTNGLEYALSPVGYTVASTVSQGRVSPSQELVDAFPMANGKAISDATSGYNPASPYTGRDPRLAITVFYNGQTWLNRSVETFVNGKDNLNATPIKTRTGYYERKFLGNYATGSTYNATYRPWPYIRYAEILLDFAEARNEQSGPDNSIVAALTAIRARAGISSANNFGIPALTATQAQMRDFIRNERRIEMAFEEQRYWDLRRWKTALAAYAGGISGMNIIKNADGSLTYTRVPVVTPFFEQRMYLYPIPYSQMIITKNLVQNAGW